MRWKGKCEDPTAVKKEDREEGEEKEGTSRCHPAHCGECCKREERREPAPGTNPTQTCNDD
eukprot:2920036-Rhodomonas_salina.1